MALIVEDGSQVSNSDSYVSRADYIAYAATLGTTITDADAATEPVRYINANCDDSDVSITIWDYYVNC